MAKETVQLPRSITIGGKAIRIKIDTRIPDYGQYDHDSGIIIIGPPALKSQKTALETLRHEMIHAALSISGVSYAEKLDEESVVRCMEQVFFPAWDRFTKKQTKTTKS